MVHACGAHFHECEKQKVAEAVERVIQECELDGMKPYYIYGDKFGHGNGAYRYVLMKKYIARFWNRKSKWEFSLITFFFQREPE